MKILIINPPFYRLQRASLVHYPPGCCYMAAALERAGFPSLIYNTDYDFKKKTILGNTNHLQVTALTNLADEYQKRLNNLNDPLWLEIKDYLLQFKPDILILSVFSTTLTAGNIIAKMAKAVNPAVKTVYEGSTNRGLHCAVDPSLSEDTSSMDFVLRREPEATVVELIEAIKNSQADFSHILGLSWKNNQGAMVRNADRPEIQDLDTLPFPARHLLDGFEKMPPHAFQGIYGSRGCPFDCIFCGCHVSWGYKPRLRSAKNMVDEIEEVHKRFKTRYFYICDDIFFIKKERAEEFCELLIERRLNVFWSAQTRAEMVDPKTLALMKKAGGQHVAVGVEVGNPHVRELIKKGNTVEDVRRCARLIHESGLRMVAFCIMGLPWEGPKELQDTLNLVKEIKPYIVYPYLSTPAAGTELAQIMLLKNPEGLKAYRDKCHIDPSSALSEELMSQEKKSVIEKALKEFAGINRMNLAKDVFIRPFFYLALAQDMDFFKRPLHFLAYLREYANS